MDKKPLDDETALAIVNSFLGLEQPAVRAMRRDASIACSALLPVALANPVDVELNIGLAACSFYAAICHLRGQGYSFALIEPKEKP